MSTWKKITSEGIILHWILIENKLHKSTYVIFIQFATCEFQSKHILAFLAVQTAQFHSRETVTELTLFSHYSEIERSKATPRIHRSLYSWTILSIKRQINVKFIYWKIVRKTYNNTGVCAYSMKHTQFLLISQGKPNRTYHPSIGTRYVVSTTRLIKFNSNEKFNGNMRINLIRSSVMLRNTYEICNNWLNRLWSKYTYVLLSVNIVWYNAFYLIKFSMALFYYQKIEWFNLCMCLNLKHMLLLLSTRNEYDVQIVIEANYFIK